MKRIKIVGLCLIAVFALGAMIASAAQAAEYGRCVKLAGKTGGYTNAGCTTKSVTHHGEYEWEAGPGSKAGYTSSTGTLRLKAEGSIYLECEESTAVGEITGPKTGVDTITLERCEGIDAYCQNSGTVEKPAPLGVVVTNLLDTKPIGYGEKGLSGLEPKEGEVWTQFVSPTGFEAEYECAGGGIGRGILFRIKGSLSAVTTPVNTMTTSFTTKFAKGRGEQNIKLEQSTNSGISWTVHGAAEYITEATTTTEEALEIKA